MPLGLFSPRNGLLTGTLLMATANKSGRSVMALPIKMPPALVPSPISFFAEVYPLLIKYSPQEIKSFHVLGLVDGNSWLN